MIPLETDRLRLRPFCDSPADLAFIREVHANPDLVRFIPSAVTPDAAAAHRRLERFLMLEQHPVQGFSLVELRAGGEAVGLIMVKPVPPSGGGEPDTLEIGWRQVAEHCGHGYATEAARAVLDEVHARGVRDVVAVVHPDNLSSQHVAERIGMEPLGLSSGFYDTETMLYRSHRERLPETEWLPEGWELLPEGLYAFPGPLRAQLVDAILVGAKRTTSYLLAEDTVAGDVPRPVGSQEVVIDQDGKPVCVTCDAAVDVVRLAEVTFEHVLGEGEGDESVAAWREGHERYWASQSYQDWFRSQGQAPPVVDDDALIVCVRFEVVARAGE